VVFDAVFKLSKDDGICGKEDHALAISRAMPIVEALVTSVFKKVKGQRTVMAKDIYARLRSEIKGLPASDQAALLKKYAPVLKPMLPMAFDICSAHNLSAPIKTSLGFAPADAAAIIEALAAVASQ
jgi:hypothetical protein